MTSEHLPADHSARSPEEHESIAERSRNGIEFLPPVDDPKILRVLAVGRRPVVNRFVHRLHQLNVAHYNEWTRLLRTPNEGEFMRMLTKRIAIESVPPASDRAD